MYRFPRAPRVTFAVKPIPGPGAYENVNLGKRGPNPIMTGRLAKTIKDLIPGPGQYEQTSTLGLAGLKSLDKA